MERSNFCRLSCGLDFETGRSDRDGVAQKSLEVLDGPFESDDSIMNSESFAFDEVRVCRHLESSRLFETELEKQV